MNRRFLPLSLLVTGALALGLGQTTPALAAQDTTRITGGGTATFDNIAGLHSQFGIGVVIDPQSGLAQGHFECVVAGIDTAPGQEGIFAGLPGAIQGRVFTGEVFSDGSAIFYGLATLVPAKGTLMKNIPFAVAVEPGGPGVGHFILFIPGFGVADAETVATGGIKVH